MMRHQRLLDIPVETNIRGIDSRVLVDHEHATIKQLIVKANGTIPPHQVPVDVTFFVLEGTGTISIDNETYHVGPNSIVICPSNTLMSIMAKDTGLSFLNIKTPGFKPTK